MTIPSSTAPFFQEYDFARLDARGDAPIIIERILAYGNRAELRWLVSQYGQETIRAWIAQSGPARLPRGRYRLWRLVFNLAEEPPTQGLWQR